MPSALPLDLDHDNLLTSPFTPHTATVGSANSYLPKSALYSVDNDDAGSQISLGINYLPKKFSSSILSGGPGRSGNKGKHVVRGSSDRLVPKWGGGVDAFGTDQDVGVYSKGKRRSRWNKFKWTMFVTNMLLTLSALAGLVICLLFWFDVFTRADVIRVGNQPELIMSTVAASFALITAIIGWSGILLNNRQFLAVYTLFTWLTFAALVIPGYVAFRRRSLNLEGKLNAQWSRDLGVEARLRVQNELKCCGWFSPFVEATVSSTCYSRSILPGCKKAYLDFQRRALGNWALAVFSLVPLQIAVMTSAILCSNQVTYRFGKGMMPEQYRLNPKTMSVIMDNYKSQLEREALEADSLRRRSWVAFGSGSDIAGTPVHSPRPRFANANMGSAGSSNYEPHYRRRSALSQVPFS